MISGGKPFPAATAPFVFACKSRSSTLGPPSRALPSSSRSLQPWQGSVLTLERGHSSEKPCSSPSRSTGDSRPSIAHSMIYPTGRATISTRPRASSTRSLEHGRESSEPAAARFKRSFSICPNSRARSQTHAATSKARPPPGSIGGSASGWPSHGRGKKSTNASRSSNRSSMPLHNRSITSSRWPSRLFSSSSSSLCCFWMSVSILWMHSGDEAADHGPSRSQNTNATGPAKISESTTSRIPPKPGTASDASFRSQSRLIIDSIKSPT